MKKVIWFLTIVLVSSSALLAQGAVDGTKPQGENLQVPTGWMYRFDKPNPDLTIGARPDSSDIYFVNMTPGWHLTTGPAGIYYHPGNTASDDYTLSTTMYVFDTKGRDREAFGLFVGGNNLDNEQQQYLYFLIRNTGDYLIKSRIGAETTTLKPWTATEAMNRFNSDSDGSEKNDLTIDVKDGMMHFHLNGVKLTSIAKGDWQTNGHYGFRVNHSINLHIANLSVDQQ